MTADVAWSTDVLLAGPSLVPRLRIEVCRLPLHTFWDRWARGCLPWRPDAECGTGTGSPITGFVRWAGQGPKRAAAVDRDERAWSTMRRLSILHRASEYVERRTDPPQR